MATQTLGINFPLKPSTESQALMSVLRKHWEKGLVTLAKFPYVLCQQSLFGVEESCLPIANYYIFDT